MQGIDTREVIKDVNREQAKTLNPGNIPQAAIMSPQPANLSKVGDDSRMIADALDMAANYATDRIKEQTEADYTNGQIMRHQGKAYKEAKEAGGYIGDGWQIADVQIAATDMLNNQRGLIKSSLYASSPEQYREHLNKYSQEIDQFTKSFEGYNAVVQKSIGKTKLAMIETLAEEQARAHIDYNYNKTVDSIGPLIESALNSGDPDALEKAKAYMRPGAFAVDPRDAKNAIDKYLDDKAELVQTRPEYNVWATLRAEQLQNTAGTTPSAPTGIAGAPLAAHAPSESGAGAPSAPSAASAPGALPVKTGKQVDMRLPDMQGAADAAPGFDKLHARMVSSAPPGVGELGAPIRDSKAAQVLSRVERNELITASAKSGYMGRLTEKELPDAFKILWAETEAETSRVVPVADKAAFEQVFDTKYAQKLSTTSRPDPMMKARVSAGLFSITEENKDAAVESASFLQKLQAAGGDTLAMEYVSPENHDTAARILSYMNEGATPWDAVANAARVEKQVEAGVKPSMPTDNDIRAAIKRLRKDQPISGTRLFNTQFFNNGPLDNMFFVFAPTAEELTAPSYETQLLEARVAQVAKTEAFRVREPSAAAILAVSKTKPLVQYIAAKPMLADIPWTDKLNDAVPDTAPKLPPGLLDKNPNLMNAAAMFILKQRADVFKEHYKTFKGKNNTLGTWVRGVPDYRELSVHTLVDGISIHTYTQDVEDANGTKIAGGVETTERVHITYDELQRAVLELSLRASSPDLEVRKELAAAVTDTANIYRPPYRQATNIPEGYVQVRGNMFPVDKDGNFENR